MHSLTSLLLSLLLDVCVKGVCGLVITDRMMAACSTLNNAVHGS